MMFHFAPPDVNGFGSSTSTLPVTRSSQPLMFLGLPLRTMRTTTELVTIPLCSFWFQLLSTRSASTSRVMSGSSENSTTSAGRPPSTARDCSPDAA
jgi:hypothetical protein